MKIEVSQETLKPLEDQAVEFGRLADLREEEAAGCEMKAKAIRRDARGFRGRERQLRRAIALLKGESLAKSGGGKGGVRRRKRVEAAVPKVACPRLAGVSQERIIESAIVVVSDEFEVTTEGVRGRSQADPYRVARAAVMYIANELGASLSTIGDVLDGRAMQGIAPTIKTFTAKLERDRDLAALVSSLVDRTAERAEVVK